MENTNSVLIAVKKADRLLGIVMKGADSKISIPL